ncbi:unnamed protein product [Nippostrongylus brasiliensis]|uniref:ET module n=1 Tax=Nippostrongylus brasiliensis TaxID=27835 RepID=A0A0N4XEE9_NIPBR|nr:unnamed protein product [Nippostrongylus brasiliensis]
MLLELVVALAGVSLIQGANFGSISSANDFNEIQPFKSESNGPLKCYVGILSIGGLNPTDVGAEVLCDGLCGTIGASMVNKCSQTGEVTGCCCSTDNCNLNGTNIVGSLAVQPTEEAIVCYTGITTSGIIQPGSGWNVCRGECMTIKNGDGSDATVVYSCFPTSVSQTLGTVNNCQMVGNGITACACTSDSCADPSIQMIPDPAGAFDSEDSPISCWTGIYVNGMPVPGVPLMCYVGLFAPGSGINAGGEMACDGQCATLSSYVSGNKVTIFQCLSSNTCSALGLDNTCASLPMDRQYMNITAHPLPISTRPISCWNGEYLNGQPLDKPRGYQVCNGQCASFTQDFIYEGNKENLGLNNTCKALPGNSAGTTACCCDTADSCNYHGNPDRVSHAFIPS